MFKSKTFWLLVVILIIATFFRFYQIKTIPPGLYPDEAMNGNNALEALHTGQFKVFYPENNGREGLLINVQALFLKIFGANEPWVLRLPSAIFGVLTVLGLYLLAAELFSKNIGLLSAFLLAASFWHINFSRIGFRAILAPLLLTWALYFLLKAFRNARPKSYILNSIFSGIIYGLGFYTYIAYRVTPLLILFIAVYFWKRSGDKERRKVVLLSTSCFLLSTFLIALPIGIYFLRNPADFLGRTSQISIFSSATPLRDLGLNILKTAGMFNVRGDYNWRHNYAGQPELFWPVGLLFLFGIVVGLKKILRAKESGDSNRFPPLLIFLWMIFAAIPVVISNEGMPHALRSILLIPPAIMLAGIGGRAAYETLKNRVKSFLLRTAAIIFLTLLVFETYSAYFFSWAKNPNTRDAFSADYVEIGRAILNLPASTPKYVVVEAPGVLVRGIPMPAQTVMFITDTFLPQNQIAKNVHYVLPDQEKSVPADAIKFYLK
jgi:4-amino-4-deoxy-L-arabinose transferase-like glycosyltransferase